MKVLIVEDNTQKMEEIIESIQKMKIGIDIEKRCSIVACLTFLVRSQVDILILDAQLPATDGNKNILENGGKEIIKALINDRAIKRPKKLIYLSAYPEALDEQINDFPQTAILYQHNSVEWKTKLQDNIQFYYDSVMQDERQFKYDAVFITATPVEYQKLHELSKEWCRLSYKGDNAYYEETCWQRNGHDYKIIGCKLNQMGMAAAATVTTKVIEQFSPRYVVMCGIAGGIDKGADYGDVIVATKVWDYCSGKYDAPPEIEEREPDMAIKNFRPTSNAVNADSQVINMQDWDYGIVLDGIFRSIIPSKRHVAPKLWWGSFACGSSVVKNRTIVDEMILKFDRKTLGIDMESYGVFYAVENAIYPQPRAICAKAISDFADRDKSDDYQEYAAEVSAKFAKEFVLELLEGE